MSTDAIRAVYDDQLRHLRGIAASAETAVRNTLLNLRAAEAAFNSAPVQSTRLAADVALLEADIAREFPADAPST